MLLLYSPFSFLFLFIYLLLLSALLSVSDFLYFWLLIEFLMLLFIGISYTLFTNNVSSLIIYFFIQSLSSFLLLLSYFLVSVELFTFAVFLNLGMFPFVSWYVSSISFFPSSLFFLASTFQKIPIIVMLVNTSVGLAVNFFWVSAVTSVLLGGVLIISSQSIRFLLVASSVGNNGWLLLAAQSNLGCVLLFILVYFLLVFLILTTLKQLSEPVHFSNRPATLSSLLILCSLSGVPPSPLFLGNVGILLSLLDYSPLTWPLLAFLVLSVASSSAYVCFSIKLYTYAFRA